VKAVTRYRAASVATTLAGIVLFAVLVYQTGWSTIAESIRACGSIFVALILVAGVRHLLRTLVWYLCIEPQHRTIPFLDLFNIRLAAEAITDLTFAGPLLGESAKAVAVSQRIPATDTLSSIVIENLLYSLSVVLFIMSGVIAFLAGTSSSGRTRAIVLLVSLGLFVPIVAIQAAIAKRFLLLSSLLDLLGKRGVRVKAVERRRDELRRFEEHVVAFYAGHRARLLAAFGIELVTNVTGLVEAYLILGVTAGDASLFAAYVIESVNRIVNAVFPFLPLRLGVDEGGTALVFHALGYTTAAGVSLAVIRKIRNIFWIGVGLACMARYAVFKPSTSSRSGGE
jgi:hypothetical protein